MTTKNIAMIALLSTLLTSAPCIAEATKETHSISSMISAYGTYARLWATGFFVRCWNVGLLPTLYTTVGIYDLKRISGLNANNTEELKRYNDIAQLEKAKKRVETMIEYGPSSAGLNQFYGEIQGRIMQIQHNQEAAK